MWARGLFRVIRARIIWTTGQPNIHSLSVLYVGPAVPNLQTCMALP